ncbi:MAG: helix-turn-helix transcriptional regulator [Paenibacillaceae bacterium]|nr:helix-turn-helix transcriptional regulator [Paenibacillaceae bacterium]
MASLNFANSLDHLSVKLRWTARYAYFPGPMQVKRPTNPYSIFWLVLSGSRELRIDETDYVIDEDCLVCIPPHCKRTDLHILGDKKLEYLVVCCDFTIGLLDVLCHYRMPVVSHVATTFRERFVSVWEQLDTSGQQLLETLGQTDGVLWDESRYARLNTQQTALYLRLHALLLDWLSLAMQALQPLMPGSPPLIDERINRACDYIERHLADKQTIKRLADRAYLSPSQFQLLFRRSLGLSPMKYVQKQRFGHASKLLLGTDQSIKEIGEAVGFPDQRHFSKWFKQIGGLSPSQYRRQRF